MQTTHFINDVELTITYDATPYVAATWDDPAEGGETEITSITMEGNEVYDLLAPWVIKECEEACQSAAPQAFRDAKEDYLIGLAEQRYADRHESMAA